MEEYKIFLDTNILVDLRQKRLPNYHLTRRLIQTVVRNKIYISALTIPNLVYITKESSLEKIRKLTNKLEIVSLTKEIIDKALRYPGSDFEDAIQVYSALEVSHMLITWDKKGFKPFKNEIIVLTPEEFLRITEK